MRNNITRLSIYCAVLISHCSHPFHSLLILPQQRNQITKKIVILRVSRPGGSLFDIVRQYFPRVSLVRISNAQLERPNHECTSQYCRTSFGQLPSNVSHAYCCDCARCLSRHFAQLAYRVRPSQFHRRQGMGCGLWGSRIQGTIYHVSSEPYVQ